HPVLMAQRDQRQQRKGRPAPGGPIRKRNCYFCREKIEEVDYKNANQLRRYVSEKGKIPPPPHTGRVRPPPAAGRAGREAGTRDGAPPILDGLMEVILRQDVEKVGLRGEVVDVAPGFARNYLLPRKLAETAT